MNLVYHHHGSTISELGSHLGLSHGKREGREEWSAVCFLSDEFAGQLSSTCSLTPSRKFLSSCITAKCHHLRAR